MNYTQAIAALKKGKRVRRPHWGEDLYLYVPKGADYPLVCGAQLPSQVWGGVGQAEHTEADDWIEADCDEWHKVPGHKTREVRDRGAAFARELARIKVLLAAAKKGRKIAPEEEPPAPAVPPQDDAEEVMGDLMAAAKAETLDTDDAPQPTGGK